MNKVFDITIRFEGCMVYEVEAETEEAAKAQAEELFGEESDTIIVSEISDCCISECIER